MSILNEPDMKETIKKLGGLLIQNINDGFDNYLSEIVEGSEEELYQFLNQLRIDQGPDYSFVDFYYGKLEKEEKDRIKERLPEYLQDIIKDYETEERIFYRLTDELFELTTYLTAKEYLFSTFYFCKTPCTVWGNYQRRYVIFR